MSELATHRWGSSPYVDRVWSQVAGMAPAELGRAYFMVLQAFIDESVGRGGTYVFAGHIAPVEAWAKFSAEWEGLLRRHGTLAPDGHYHFKMSDMAQLEERKARVPAFYKVLEKHVSHSISCSFNVNSLDRAIERIHIPGMHIDWKEARSEYFLAFRILMDQFHGNRGEFLNNATFEKDARVDFYFDENSEKGKIRSVWDAFMANRPASERRLYGNEPRFEDDRVFLPLQAADMWAWWVRKWTEDGFEFDAKFNELDFGTWRGKGHPRSHVRVNEDHLVKALTILIGNSIPPGLTVFDRKTGAILCARGPSLHQTLP